MNYDSWKTEDVEGDAAHAAWERWYDDHYEERRKEWLASYYQDNPGDKTPWEAVMQQTSKMFEMWMESEYEDYERGMR